MKFVVLQQIYETLTFNSSQNFLVKVLVSAHLVLNFLRLLKLGGENPAHSEMDS